MKDYKVIAVIPARSGSKSIPDKNIKKFAGKPLLVHSIEAALSSSYIDRTILSTDSKRIAKIGREAGAEVPFLRPSKYAKDNTPDLPVFIHCLEWLRVNEGYVPDIVVHLRPTSPLRTPSMIEKAICMLTDNPRADTVRTVCEPTQSPFKMWTIGKNGFLDPFKKTDIKEQWNQPRQELPVVYWQNGYVDVTRIKTILKKNSMTGDRILPLVVDAGHTIDIDNEVTFKLAETIYRKRQALV